MSADFGRDATGSSREVVRIPEGDEPATVTSNERDTMGHLVEFVQVEGEVEDGVLERILRRLAAPMLDSAL